jgi:hypothetical protein
VVWVFYDTETQKTENKKKPECLAFQRMYKDDAIYKKIIVANTKLDRLTLKWWRKKESEILCDFNLGRNIVH